MLYWVLLAVLLVILAGMAALLNKVNRKQAEPADTPAEPTPFKRNRYFLSQAEQAFFHSLRAAAGQQFHLLAKVHLFDVLWLPSRAQNKQRFVNMVQSKHLDFVLCDPKTMIPALAVELDDASHQRPETQRRDAVKDRVLQDAGLPILRVKVQPAYDPTALAAAIRQAIAPANAPAAPVPA